MSCLTLALVVVTVVSAVSSVNAFRLGNYDIGLGGIKKAQSEEYDGPTVPNSVILDAVNHANKDKRATLFLKSGFSGDTFCVKTEKRVAYAKVQEDGTISLLDEKPEDCHVIRSTEQFAYHAWQRYLKGDIMKYREVKDHVEIPWHVKAKVAWMRIIS